MASQLTEFDWQVRTFIYEFFVANGQPPTVADAAQKFGIDEAEAKAAYQRLNDVSQLFLEPHTHQIRMANPLSAVPTDYRVQVNGVWLYANCAWDTVGIAALCHSDAQVEATLPVSREKITYQVVDGELQAADNLKVHIPLPARRWYENLIHT
jgi:hypothetical protein